MTIRNRMDYLLERHLHIREDEESDGMVNTFVTRGNAELLSQKKLAIFASNGIQSANENHFVDFFERLKTLPLALASGWHSFLEKILFNTASDTDCANYIYYLGRDLNTYRFSEHQLALMQADKLLVIARDSAQKRISKHSAGWRNRLIFSQMSGILFLYIRPEGILHNSFEQLRTQGSRIFLLDIPENRHFICRDVVPVHMDTVSELLVL